ncbi:MULTISPECIES: hypothetical protein [unclassified Mesorhizobium]|uniref:hypothetical protein n=1 Tax=unclassified Mesorhizobium TaxID=325217 RepID=UPI001FD9B888|nr:MULTISPECIES: hypothetical protein [unclassified Mesorhizobium]
MDIPAEPIANRTGAGTLAGMVAEHVEMVLFEQSLGDGDGMHRPFGDRVADAAAKTSGTVLFDVRIYGDNHVQRMAAIGYDDAGTAIVLMEKTGDLRCASVNGETAVLVAELAAWESSPLSEHARVDFRGAAAMLLAKLRSSGHFGRSS